MPWTFPEMSSSARRLASDAHSFLVKRRRIEAFREPVDDSGALFDRQTQDFDDDFFRSHTRPCVSRPVPSPFVVGPGAIIKP